MSGDVVQREKGGKKGLRRPKRRISIRIDMTPMVDIAFLLLIFYMVSTVFSMPQAMEINLPPAEEKETKIDIKASNLLTLRVDEESRFWWNIGFVKPDSLPQLLPGDPNKPDTVVYKFNADTLRGLLTGLNRDNSKLNTVIKIHKDATYADFVNILDEIDVIERSWNAYTARELKVKIEDFMREYKYKGQRFSYRYALDDWQDQDDKKLNAAKVEAIAKGLM